MTFQAYLTAVMQAVNSSGDHRAALFVAQEVDPPNNQQLTTFLGILDTIIATETKKSGLGAKETAQVDARRDAIGLILNFVHTGPVTGAFSHIDRNIFCFQLALRVRRPKIIDQDQTTLCGPVALVVDVAKRDPVKYVRMALDLFETGRAYWGTKELAPGIIVRQGYNRLTPKADYIVLASIRDAWAIILESDTIRNIFTLTKPGALCQFLEDAGYTEVMDRTFFNMTTPLKILDAITPHPLHGQNHQPGDRGIKSLRLAEQEMSIGRSVVLNAAGTLSHIIGGDPAVPAPGPIDPAATHWTLLRKLTFIGTTHVAVRLITWGGARQRTIPLNVFLSYYCGYVSANPG
ncbi:MAG TPA: hypothetical protein VHD85_12280 [Terracidiphilus sp.]|nr:hypothetical protein [Terracidiphilus sp.]